MKPPLLTVMTLLITLLTTNAMLLSQNIMAHGNGQDIQRKRLSSTALPNLPNHSLTSVVIELKPGSSAPSHQHEGFVFVYVIKGKVLSQLNRPSQLNQEGPVAYASGDSWVEHPGDQHTITRNLSNNESAKILAVFVAENGAKLTTSGEISH